MPGQFLEGWPAVEVLDNIPVEIGPETAPERMRMRRQDRTMEELATGLVALAKPVARPKAVYEAALAGRYRQMA